MLKAQVSWTGVFVPALTMFDPAGELDVAATAAHLDRLVEEGAQGIVVAGTSGEFVTLDEVERRRILEIGVAAVRGRVPVIAGTGYASTAATIRLTKHAAAVGADGAIVILPYYLRPTEHEVIEHFRAVGRASPIPVMVYNNPENSSAPALSATQIRDLYEAGHVHAVKSTFASVHEIHELRAEMDDGFRVFYGSFMAPLEAMAGGAHGWISGILNVVTADAVEMLTAMQAGDLDRARRAWARILPIKLIYTRQMLGRASDLAIYRGILRLTGHQGGQCRAPLLGLSDPQLDNLRTILVAAGRPPNS